MFNSFYILSAKFCPIYSNIRLLWNINRISNQNNYFRFALFVYLIASHLATYSAKATFIWNINRFYSSIKLHLASLERCLIYVDILMRNIVELKWIIENEYRFLFNANQLRLGIYCPTLAESDWHTAFMTKA